jgi:hypothetical protein
MSADELIDTARRGMLKTPEAQRERQVQVLDIAGNIAAERVKTPWFVDFPELGRSSGRWLIVNALWWNKPQPATVGR